VHTVVGTAANVNDVTQASALVHGEETDVFADAGYQGVAKRDETRSGMRSALERPAKSRYSGVSNRASSISSTHHRHGSLQLSPPLGEAVPSTGH
jgi:IS5 family transposase